MCVCVCVHRENGAVNIQINTATVNLKKFLKKTWGISHYGKGNVVDKTKCIPVW